MDILIRILITLFTLGFSAEAVPPVNDLSSQSPNMRIDTVIEEVNVRVMESFPVQIVLEVRGYQPDGCDYPVEVAQSRAENTVEVDIFREVPPDVMCTMQLVPYSANIPLGRFESGTYQINVNGMMLEVTV